MPKEVVIVTTKPDANTAEYGIRDTETGEWTIHGVQIAVEIGEIPEADQAKLADARGVMLSLATADAQTRKLI